MADLVTTVNVHFHDEPVPVEVVGDYQMATWFAIGNVTFFPPHEGEPKDRLLAIQEIGTRLVEEATRNLEALGE